eukprot:gene9568-1771_t
MFEDGFLNQLYTILSFIGRLGKLFLYFFFCRWNLIYQKTKHKTNYVNLTEVDPVLKLSGNEMAKMIKEKKISSYELVKKHIFHLKMINPLLNAIVEDRFYEARKEAIECDKILEKIEDTSDLPPLFGVPITIKESFAVKGMSHSSGIYTRKDIKASKNAVVVERLFKAGAIPLCVTNTSEGCFWMECSNHVSGITNNPFNTKMTPGGSSGGEAAIVSGCGAPFGIGSDVGGSIRMPAYFCGVFGHKPSSKLIPNLGHYPQHFNEQDTFSTSGPIARRAEDLWTVLSIIADKELSPTPSSVDVSKLRILNVERIDRVLLRNVSKELVKTQSNVVDHLKSIGCLYDPSKPQDLDYALEIWSCMMHIADSPSYHELIGKPFVIWEILKWIFNLSYHTFPGLTACYIEQLPLLSKTVTNHFCEKGNTLRNELNDLLADDGVLIFPSHPVSAPKHNSAKFIPVRWCYTAIFNALELPVTQVPIGVGKNGMPLGVQIVAAHGNDHLTIAVAQELEKKFGGWQLDKKFIPPTYSK